MGELMKVGVPAELKNNEFRVAITPAGGHEAAPEEYQRMRPGQVLFSYLHLAAARECAEALLSRNVTAIAYETVQLPDGSLPLLAPMSEVAGRMAPQVGAHHLQRDGGGRG